MDGGFVIIMGPNKILHRHPNFNFTSSAATTSSECEACHTFHFRLLSDVNLQIVLFPNIQRLDILSLELEEMHNARDSLLVQLADLEAATCIVQYEYDCVF